MKTILTIFVLFLAIIAFSQAPAIQWQKSYGGSENDEAQSIQETPDHGFIVAGRSTSDDGDVTGHHYDYDAWIVKLDSVGYLQWERSYGGNQYDEVRSIRCTTDGGYIFVGKSFSVDGNVTGHHGTMQYADVWVVKLDSDGNIEWEKSYGGTSSESGWDIQQTYDGGYIVAANSISKDGDVTGHHGDNLFDDYWVFKLSPAGDIEWENCYGGTSNEEPCSVLQLQGGAYVVTGFTDSNDGDVTGHHGSKYSYDVWLIKLSSSGKLLAEECLPNSQSQFPEGVCFSNTRGYIIAGIGRSYPSHGIYQHGLGDMMIMKVSRLGKLDTVCLLGGSQEDNANAIAQARDGGYIAAGQTYSSDGDVTGHHCGGNPFCFTNDGWIVKVDSSLKMQWQETIGGPDDDYANAIQQTDDGGYIIAGWNGDFWIVKLAPDNHSVVTSTDQAIGSENNGNHLSVYPNPASNEVNVSFPFSNNIITISDLYGRELRRMEVGNGNSMLMDVSSLQDGVYILSIRDDKGNLVASEKLFKQ